MPVIYNEYHTGIYNWIKQKNISKVLFSVKSTNSQRYSEKRHCLVPLALIIHILNDWYGNKNYEILGVAICVALLRALLVNLSSHGYGEGSYFKKNPVEMITLLNRPKSC